MRRLRRIARWLVLALGAFYGLAALAMVYLRFLPPLTTSVQAQRRIEAWLTWSEYDKQATWVPLERISPHLRHAVIAAEDGRFYDHGGLDWFEMQKVFDQSRRRGKVTRGASTITQQLVKNLFLTTYSTWLRKALELPLALMAELILGKRRILELYLNVVEWGPGVFGAEAAAAHHYRGTAAGLGREPAARLAACLPSPRRRRPQQMNSYSRIILRRMKAMGY